MEARMQWDEMFVLTRLSHVQVEGDAGVALRLQRDGDRVLAGCRNLSARRHGHARRGTQGKGDAIHLLRCIPCTRTAPRIPSRTAPRSVASTSARPPSSNPTRPRTRTATTATTFSGKRDSNSFGPDAVS